MELFEAIYTRRAIRKFTDTAIDRNTILSLVDAGIQAPSALDLQPWAFAVILKRALLDRISSASKEHLLAGSSSVHLLAKYREMLSDPSFDILYGAPALVVICADSAVKTEAAEEDCCLAAENLMLAAHAKALGTCWIGFAQPWLTTKVAKKELGIPIGWRPIAPIVLGEPAHLPPPPPRREAKIVWSGTKAHEALS